MSAQNLLVIMSDEHDPRYMGVSGDAQARTPNLDRLAASGVRFTEAYTPSPICVPARAAFATGAHVHDIGYWDNAIGYDGRVKGWGHVLQHHGIRVESIGKLHYQSDAAPAGFDVEHIPMNLYNGHGMVWGSIRDPLPHNKPHEGRMLGPRIGPGESSYTKYDGSVTDMTIDWLADAAHRREEPWCLYVGLVAPHFPLVVAEEFLAMYPLDQLPPRKLDPRDGYTRHPWTQRQHEFFPSDDQFESDAERQLAIACYLGLVSWMDHNVGRMLDQLEAVGLAGDTRVIYTSDHGDNVGHRGLWGKSNFYLESAAVPMLMSGPGITPSTCNTPVSLIDVQPTILEHFNLPVDAAPLGDDVARSGRSLLQLATEPDDTGRAVLSQYHAVSSPSAGFMLRSGAFKYHHYVGYPPELFHLESDPEELNDLAHDPAYAEVLAQMEASLRDMLDPDAVDRRAKDDQNALIERHGGVEAAKKVGAPAATPVPGLGAKFGT